MAQNTTDYKKFKYMGGNRRVSKLRVDHLAKSMALYPEIFQYRPITVNERFEIVDGQHRFNAAKKLGIPVWYEVVEGIGQDQAILINQNQANWELLDYARSYAHAGNQHYKDFLGQVKKHPHMPIHTLIQYTGGNSANKTANFRSGEYKAVTLAIGEVYLDYLEDIANHVPKAKLSTPSRAFFRIFQTEGYDHDRMLAKLAISPEDTLRVYGKVEDVLRSAEDVYNWKQQKDILRFY